MPCIHDLVFALRVLEYIHQRCGCVHAVFVAYAAHNLVVVQRGGTDAHLGCACGHHRVRIVQAFDAAAHAQRHRAVRRRSLDHVQIGLASLGAGGNIQQPDFVRAFGTVALDAFNRVARVLHVFEVYALDHAAVLYIQAGNDFDRIHAV